MSEQLTQAAVAADVQASGLEGAAASGGAPARQNSPKQGNRGPRQGKKKKPRPPPERRPAIKLDDAAPRVRQRPRDQGRKDGQRSNREIARENMINFLPIASHPAQPCQLELRTEYTLRLFQDHYGRAQISLYNLMQYLPIRMRQSGFNMDQGNKLLDEIEKLVDQRIEDLKRSLKLELARAKKIAGDNGVEPVTVYSKPATQVTLPQLTPQIIDLLGLLPVFDEFIGYIDALYMNKTVSRGDREKLFNTFRNEVVTLIRYLMHLYHESKRMLEKGSAGDLAALLKDKPDANSLRDRLDDEDEEAARKMTGGEPAPAEAAAA